MKSEKGKNLHSIQFMVKHDHSNKYDSQLYKNPESLVENESESHQLSKVQKRIFSGHDKGPSFSKTKITFMFLK